MNTIVILPLSVLIPLVGSLVCFIIHRRVAVVTGLVVAGLTTLSALATAYVIATSGLQIYTLGGWHAPLGIQFRADGLSAIMIVMTGVVGLGISFYAQAYFGHYQTANEQRGAEMFWPIWLFLWGSMNALYMSADLFNIYVILEIIGLAAVGLLTLTGRRKVLIAGMRYLLAAMAGSLVYLLGVTMLYAAYSTLDIGLLSAAIDGGRIPAAAFALMLIGLLLKTAAFPLHFWLPPAHGSATAPVSAILSALVVKASFYLVLRLWFQVFHDVVTFQTGQLLGLLGTGAILWGSIQALRQTRVKMMVAYSTVAQLGYLFFVFPVSTVTDPSINAPMMPWLVAGSRGCLYQVLAHAFAKTAFFMAAGVLLHAAGSDHINHMRGLAKRLPVTVFAMALAAVSLMGLPPSGGFVAKWLTTSAVLGAGQWWWAPIVIGGGLLTAGYMFLMLRYAFSAADPDTALHKVPKSLEVCALVMALLSIGMGLRAEEILDLLMVGWPFAAPAAGIAGGGL